MVKRFYLMSGHCSNGDLMGIDGEAIATSGYREVLVLNMASEVPEKIREKEEFFEGYFSSLGAERVNIVTEETPEEILFDSFKKVGLVYLPGGDTKTLIRNLVSKGLVPCIESFDGVVSGNSAGVYALCPEYLRIGHGETEIIPSLGIMDFWSKAHYKSSFDKELERLSLERVIYALQDKSALVVDSDISFIGDVWIFSEGKKERVS